MKTLNLTLSLLTYDGAATNDPATANKIQNLVNDTNIIGITRYENQIPTATDNIAIPLPASPSNYLVILSDQQLTLTLNGSDTPLTLNPRALSILTTVFYYSGLITSVSLSNDSGYTANVTVITLEN